jgi:hypothetical protein
MEERMNEVRNQTVTKNKNQHHFLPNYGNPMYMTSILECISYDVV